MKNTSLTKFAWLSIFTAIATISTHLEPVEDPRSHEDISIERE